MSSKWALSLAKPSLGSTTTAVTTHPPREFSTPAPFAEVDLVFWEAVRLLISCGWHLKVETWRDLYRGTQLLRYPQKYRELLLGRYFSKKVGTSWDRKVGTSWDQKLEKAKGAKPKRFLQLNTFWGILFCNTAIFRIFGEILKRTWWMEKQTFVMRCLWTLFYPQAGKISVSWWLSRCFLESVTVLPCYSGAEGLFPITFNKKVNLHSTHSDLFIGELHKGPMFRNPASFWIFGEIDPRKEPPACWKDHQTFVKGSF